MFIISLKVSYGDMTFMERIIKIMGCHIDMHVHSRASGDSDADPEELILRAINIGLQGIVFTEHYFIDLLKAGNYRGVDTRKVSSVPFPFPDGF